jgi:hypothetical protein
MPKATAGIRGSRELRIAGGDTGSPNDHPAKSQPASWVRIQAGGADQKRKRALPADNPRVKVSLPKVGGREP